MQISVMNLIQASEMGVCAMSILAVDAKAKDFGDGVLETLNIQHKEHQILGLNCKEDLLLG